MKIKSPNSNSHINLLVSRAFSMSGLPPLAIRDSIIEEAARFRRHPAFPHAVRLNAEQLLTIAEGHPLLNKLVTEEARWLVGGLICFSISAATPPIPPRGPRSRSCKRTPACSSLQVRDASARWSR